MSGWTVAGAAGQFRPGSNYFNSLPDGSVVAFSNGGTILQMLTATLTADLLYTLQVDIGARTDGYVAPASIQLFAGNTLLATGNSVQPSSGNFLTSTASYQVSANDPLIGQQLKIVLSASGNQGNFDNVRLNSSDISAQGSVPEPSSMAMLLIGGIAVIAGSRRRKSRKS